MLEELDKNKKDQIKFFITLCRTVDDADSAAGGKGKGKKRAYADSDDENEEFAAGNEGDDGEEELFVAPGRSTRAGRAAGHLGRGSRGTRSGEFSGGGNAGDDATNLLSADADAEE